MKRILSIAVAAASLVGLAACSSDSKSSGDNITLPGGTLPGGGTLPNLDTLPDISIPDVSLPDELLPENFTEECQAIYGQLIAAMSQVFAPGEQTDLEQLFGDVSANVPDELQDDVQIMAGALNEFATVIQQYNGDMTNPEVAKAMELIANPEVTAASDNLNAYFEATCPQG